DLVGDGDDRHVQHGRVAQDQVLDFFRADLLAAAVDQILLAALHDDISTRVHAHHVAGAVEAVVGEGRAIVLGGPVVATDRIGPAALELPDLAGRDLVAIVVDDANLVAVRRGAALRLHDHLGRIAGPCRAEQALGHPEDLHQHRAHLAQHAAGRLGVEPRAAHGQRTHRPHGAARAAPPVHGTPVAAA